jgi:RING finger protein 121/175
MSIKQSYPNNQIQDSISEKHNAMLRDESDLKNEEVYIVPNNNHIDQQFIHDNNNNQAHVRVITRVIFLEKPVTIADFIPFIIVFFLYGLMVHMVFTAWKKIHKRSFNIFLLALVVIFPPSLTFITRRSLFFVIWVFFIFYMLFCLSKVIRTPITKDTPKQIYMSFRIIFRITYSLIILGQLLSVGFFLFYMPWLMNGLCLLFYSLYFAVLSREVVLNLSQMMASNTGFFSKEGVPGRTENNKVCMICTGDFELNQKVITLNCGHHYHVECIRGWCMIGQNTFCPYCKKGVDLSFFEVNLWEKTELSFRPLMNMLRSSIAFFIVIAGFLVYKLK